MSFSEAIFILFDTSSYLRNSDLKKTRWKIMKNLINLISSKIIDLNTGNSVGLISMSYKCSKIILNLTKEKRWNSALSQVKLIYRDKSILISKAIKKAQLALKHKKNDKQKQRLILLLSSPIHTSEEDLLLLAKDLKKNKISLDVICFGISNVYQIKTIQKISKLIKTCNRNNNCHFIHIKNIEKENILVSLRKNKIISENDETINKLYLIFKLKTKILIN